LKGLVLFLIILNGVVAADDTQLTRKTNYKVR